MKRTRRPTITKLKKNKEFNKTQKCKCKVKKLGIVCQKVKRGENGVQHIKKYQLQSSKRIFSKTIL